MCKVVASWLLVLALSLPGTALACGSDAECANDQICDDSGRCVPDGRDWKALKTELNASQESSAHILKRLLEQNNRTLDILEKASSTKRTCSISCSGRGWTNSCSAQSCSTCIAGQCSESHCEAGCKS